MVQPVSPLGTRLIAPARPAPLPSRAAERGAAEFAQAVRTADARRASEADVIDVEVIWEDGEELREPYAPPIAGRGRSGEPALPFRLTSPGAAILAYRSAATTAALPHRTIDVFA